MTSLSREVRLLNAKKGYFYFHLMFCETFFFKGQHHGRKKEELLKKSSHKYLLLTASNLTLCYQQPVTLGS